MSRPQIAIHDARTGETEQREMNDAEFAQYEADQAAWAAQQAAERAASEERAAARESAIARFKSLGFTDDEIATLVLP